MWEEALGNNKIFIFVLFCFLLLYFSFGFSYWSFERCRMLLWHSLFKVHRRIFPAFDRHYNIRQNVSSPTTWCDGQYCEPMFLFFFFHFSVFFAFSLIVFYLFTYFFVVVVVQIFSGWRHSYLSSIQSRTYFLMYHIPFGAVWPTINAIISERLTQTDEWWYKYKRIQTDTR